MTDAKPATKKPRKQRTARQHELRKAEQLERQRRRKTNRQLAREIQRDVAERAAQLPADKEADPRAFVPTDEQRAQVETLAAVGLPHEQIALVIVNPRTKGPIDEKTLQRVFEVELRSGPAKANGMVGNALYKKATGNGPQAVTAAIWWTKCRMGWRERVVAEVELRSGVLIAPGSVSADEWIAQAAKRAVEQVLPPAGGTGGTER